MSDSTMFVVYPGLIDSLPLTPEQKTPLKEIHFTLKGQCYLLSSEKIALLAQYGLKIGEVEDTSFPTMREILSFIPASDSSPIIIQPNNELRATRIPPEMTDVINQFQTAFGVTLEIYYSKTHKTILPMEENPSIFRLWINCVPAGITHISVAPDTYNNLFDGDIEPRLRTIDPSIFGANGMGMVDARGMPLGRLIGNNFYCFHDLNFQRRNNVSALQKLLPLLKLYMTCLYNEQYAHLINKNTPELPTAFSSAVQRHITEHTRQIKRNIEQVAAEIESYRSELFSRINRIDLFQRTLVGLSDTSNLDERSRSEYALIASNPMIVDIIIDGNVMKLYTIPLTINNPATDKMHALGVIEIYIDLHSKSVNFKNLTRVVGDRHAHPHVPQSSSPCLGTAQQTITELFMQGEYSTLVSYLLNYLQTCNPADAWGRNIIHFPLIEEMGADSRLDLDAVSADADVVAAFVHPDETEDEVVTDGGEDGADEEEY